MATSTYFISGPDQSLITWYGLREVLSFLWTSRDVFVNKWTWSTHEAILFKSAQLMMINYHLVMFKTQKRDCSSFIGLILCAKHPITYCCFFNHGSSSQCPFTTSYRELLSLTHAFRRRPIKTWHDAFLLRTETRFHMFLVVWKQPAVSFNTQSAVEEPSMWHGKHWSGNSLLTSQLCIRTQ